MTKRWTGTSDVNRYLYVGTYTDTTDSADNSSFTTWRMPMDTIYTADQVVLGHAGAEESELHVQGDIRSEAFESRMREEFQNIIEERLSGFFTFIIDILGIRPAGLGPQKQYTDGVFCFNCGAAIERGQEGESCEYCGR